VSRRKHTDDIAGNIGSEPSSTRFRRLSPPSPRSAVAAGQIRRLNS